LWFDSIFETVYEDILQKLNICFPFTTESRSFSKPEKSEEYKGISSSISEDRILPFEFPFYSSHELHRDLVGID